MNTSIEKLLKDFLKETTPYEKVIVIYGPTACGKTALSLDIAKYLDSEIVSVDSRQIYRYMDIGTGKVTTSEMRGIPHHMLDVISPSEKYSVVDYVDHALPIIETIHRRGKIPILCGGTGLYIDGILYEMGYPDTPPDWEYREELERIRTQGGNETLWKMLEDIDPEYAHTLEATNYRYVMRGLEVFRATGRSKMEAQGQKVPRFSPLFLTPYTDSERAKLYTRIDKRVEGMFSSGLIEEVSYIIGNFNSSCPGLATIGYQEVVDHLEGRISLEESIRLVQQHSRNYAKRQITWNKKYANT